MKKTEELKLRIKERDELKKEVSILRKELSNFNSRKKDIIESIKEKNRKAEDFKAKRDRFNSKIQELKKERGAINSLIKELFTNYKELRQNAPNKDFKKMEVELNRLEWTLQTRVLKVEKEDELVKRIEVLKTELKDFKDLIALSKEIDSKKLKSKKIHAKILAHSKESQTYHEGFLENIKEIRAFEGKIDVVNQEKESLTTKLEEFKEALKVKEEELKKLSESIESEEKQRQEKSVGELKKEAKLIYERFKKGEKLSTEDLFLLQRFGQM
jgi:phosphoserine phosphatase